MDGRRPDGPDPRLVDLIDSLVLGVMRRTHGLPRGAGPGAAPVRPERRADARED